VIAAIPSRQSERHWLQVPAKQRTLQGDFQPEKIATPIPGFSLSASRVHTEGKIYEETVEWVRKFGEEIGHPLKSKGAVVIKITAIYSATPGPDAGQRIV
jgi:hypothetical protein